MKQIKNIHVVTRTWLDKPNGNTYFAQQIILNWGLPDMEMITREFEYGYSSFVHFALQEISRQKGVEIGLLNCVPLFHVLQRGCKKSDLNTAWDWYDTTYKF